MWSEYSFNRIRNAVLWIAGNLPSDGKVPEREKSLDVARQVSQLNVRRESCRLMPDAWAAFVFSSLMRVHSEKEHA